MYVWDGAVTRGHDKKLKTIFAKVIKKYSFPYRCTDLWNHLGKGIALSRNLFEFKARFDQWVF